MFVGTLAPMQQRVQCLYTSYIIYANLRIGIRCSRRKFRAATVAALQINRIPISRLLAVAF